MAQLAHSASRCRASVVGGVFRGSRVSSASQARPPPIGASSPVLRDLAADWMCPVRPVPLYE
eukprot:2501828-Prymnesium_polylepis.1